MLYELYESNESTILDTWRITSVRTVVDMWVLKVFGFVELEGMDIEFEKSKEFENVYSSTHAELPHTYSLETETAGWTVMVHILRRC